jgi:hypothetical protein
MPYQIVISKRQDDLPVQLIKHMYKRNPHRAIEILVSVLGDEIEQVQIEQLDNSIDEVKNRLNRNRTLLERKKKLRQEGERQQIHNIEKRVNANKKYVNEEIKLLSTSDIWWIRLYSAALMRLHPNLRDNQLIQEMNDDPHEVVREVITLINK